MVSMMELNDTAYKRFLTATAILVTAFISVLAIDSYREAKWSDFAKEKGITSLEGISQFRCAANELYYVVPTGKLTDTAFKYTPTIRCSEDETESVNEAGNVLREIAFMIAILLFTLLVILPITGKQEGNQKHD